MLLVHKANNNLWSAAPRVLIKSLFYTHAATNSINICQWQHLLYLKGYSDLRINNRKEIWRLLNTATVYKYSAMYYEDWKSYTIILSIPVSPFSHMRPPVLKVSTPESIFKKLNFGGFNLCKINLSLSQMYWCACFFKLNRFTHMVLLFCHQSFIIGLVGHCGLAHVWH